jgi:hypothetical protein
MAAGHAAGTIVVDEQEERPPLGGVAVLAGSDVLVACLTSGALLTFLTFLTVSNTDGHRVQPCSSI